MNDAENDSIWIIVSIKGEPGMVFGDMRAVLANYTFAGIDPSFNGDTPQSAEYSQIRSTDIDYTLSNENVVYLMNGDILTINSDIWRLYFANKFLTEFKESNGDTPQALVYDTELNKNILTGDNPGSLMSININGLEDNVEDHDLLAMTCMGEKFYSIHQVIKRYTQNWTRNIRNDATTQKYYRIRLPDRPMLKGWQGSLSLNIQPNGVNVTYARDSFLSFYSTAFLGYRGSLRHKIMVKTSHSGSTFADQPTFWVTRSAGGYVEEMVAVGAVSAGASRNAIALSASAIPSDRKSVV